MPDEIIWAKDEAMAARIRANKPNANVQVAPPKKKSTETSEQKAARQKANRTAKEQNAAREQAARQQAAQNTRKPSGLHRMSGVRFPGGRAGVGISLVALAGGGGYAAGRVNKAVDKDTAKRTALGAGGAYGAYVSGGYAANVATRHLSRKDKASNNAIKIHREKLGLPSGGFAGNVDSKKIEEFYRTLPSEVKFSGTRRMLARTHGGGRIGRLSVPVLAAGAVGGAAYDRGKKHNSISKAFSEGLVDKSNVREFPYLSEQIRYWTAVPEFARRNPVSPLEMLSTGMLMAQAQSASRGMALDRRVVRRAGKNLASYGEARMNFNVPLGRGVVMD